MRLLFLNPPGPRFLYRGTVCTYISKARYVWKPKDFILLSGAAPAGWPIEFVDAAIDGLSQAQALARARAARPDAVIVALSSIAWDGDMAFLGALRRELPKARLLVFGEALLEPAFRAQALELADGLVLDPLRAPLEDLAQGKAASQGAPAGKGAPLERRINPPRHALFENGRYRWPFVRRRRFAAVYTQFGCPLACSYCTESGTSVTYRPAANILEELRGLKAAGVRELHVGDASFGFPRENADALLDGMLAEKLGFSWSAYVYPGLADGAFLRRMAAAGAHTVVIGVDSADAAVLAGYGRRLAPERIRSFIEDARRAGLEVCGDFVLGFKEDTRESCLRTIELAIALGLDFASFNIATPLLGSSIREDYKARGVIAEGARGFDTAGLSKIQGTPALPARELLWLRNHAVRRFYLRPSYWWRRLRRLTSVEEALLKLEEAYGVALNLLKQERTLRDGYL